MKELFREVVRFKTSNILFESFRDTKLGRYPRNFRELVYSQENQGEETIYVDPPAKGALQTKYFPFLDLCGSLGKCYVSGESNALKMQTFENKRWISTLKKRLLVYLFFKTSFMLRK